MRPLKTIQRGPLDDPRSPPHEDPYTAWMAKLRAACEAHARKKPPRKDGSKAGAVECPACGDSVRYTLDRKGLLVAKCQSGKCIGIV